MSYDKITVVINTFNSEDMIYHCLDSINQEHKLKEGSRILFEVKSRLQVTLYNSILFT